jgi:hypothetical protein
VITDISGYVINNGGDFPAGFVSLQLLAVKQGEFTVMYEAVSEKLFNSEMVYVNENLTSGVVIGSNAVLCLRGLFTSPGGGGFVADILTARVTGYFMDAN